VYWRQWKGRLYASGWPARRGRPKSALQLAWVTQFSTIARITPTVSAYERNNAVIWTSQTQWYWRDVIHSAMIGKLILDPGEVRITTPTASVYRNAAQNLTAGVWTVLTPDAKQWDNYNWWSATSHPERLTATTAGLYQVTVNVDFQNSTQGFKGISLDKNGVWTGFGQSNRPSANTATQIVMSALIYLLPGDYVVALCNHQNAGGNARLAAFQILAITPEAVT